jgi:hypothetical protein
VLGAGVPARDEAVEPRAHDGVVGGLDDRSELSDLVRGGLTLRDVEDRAVEDAVAVLLRRRLPALEDPAGLAVSRDDPVLRRVRPVHRDGLFDRARERLHIVGMDDARERAPVVRDEVRGRIAGYLLDGLADEVHRPVGVELAAEDDPRHVRDERAEFLLALDHGPLGEFALRDVEEETLDVQRLALLVPHEEGEVLDPHDAAVARDAAILGAQRLAGAAQFGELGEHALKVVRVDDPLDEIRVVAPQLRWVPEHRLDLRAHVDVRGADVEPPDVHGERQLLEQRLVAGLGLAQVRLGLLAQAESLLERARLVGQAPGARLEGARDLAKDGEERHPEREQREAERERDGQQDPADRRGDRLVVLVDLEHAGRPVGALDVQRHEGFHHPEIVFSLAVTLEVAVLLDGFAPEGDAEIGEIALFRGADERMLVRVRDPAVSAPELHTCEAADELVLEELVERLQPLAFDRRVEVRRTQVVGEAGGHPARPLPDLVPGALLRLVADEPEDSQAREQERDRAVQREAQDQARGPVSGRAGAHPLVIGVASGCLKLRAWTAPLAI